MFFRSVSHGLRGAFLLLVAASLPMSAGAQGFPFTFADIVEDVLPTVVVVEVSSATGQEAEPSLEDFFGGEAPGGTGSGFFIDDQGHIATNEHVVSIGEVVSVVLADGSTHPAEVLGVDVDTDLAVLKIDPTGLDIKAVEWADSDQLRVGDWVIAVGNPLNVGITVTHGIVSALDRDLSRGNPFDQRIQTDASINSGNSGGPSFNIDGKVIGVNQSIISRTGGSVGLGFIIPSNVAQQIVEQLRDFGEVRRGFLGITFSEMTDELRERLNIDGQGGVLVNQVFDGLPADRAGIQEGDVLFKFQGRDIEKQDDFIQMVAATPPGSVITVEVFRDGELFDMEVELTLRETESLAQQDQGGAEGLQDQYGAIAVGLSLAERLLLNLNPDDGGVRLLAIAEDSPFALSGLEAGDIVQEVDTTRVFNADELYSTLEARAEEGMIAVKLVYLRDEEQRVVEMELP